MFLVIINTGEYIKYDRLGVGETVSVAKSTYYSCRRSRFMSQHPQGSSQPSLTLVPGDSKLSSDLHGQQACTRCTCTHAGMHKVHMHTFRPNV